MKAVLALMAFAAPLAAEGAPKRIAILPSIVGEAGDQPRAIELAEAIEQSIALRLELEAVTSSEILAGTDDPVLTAAERCGADLACISERLRDVDLVLRVVANQAVDPPLLSLHLIDVARAALVRELFDEVPSAQLLERAVALSRRIFEDAGYREAGRLAVEVAPPDAELEVDGDARRIDARSFLVAPGQRTVQAHREGYTAASRAVTIAPGAEASVSMTLVEEPRSIVSSPWLWTGVAAGVAVVGALIAVLVVVDPFRSDGICFHAGGGVSCN